MTDTEPPRGDPNGAERHSADRAHPTPRWVKMLGLALALLAVVLIAMAIFGGHGPGLHAGAVGPALGRF